MRAIAFLMRCAARSAREYTLSKPTVAILASIDAIVEISTAIANRAIAIFERADAIAERAIAGSERNSGTSLRELAQREKITVRAELLRVPAVLRTEPHA